MPRRYPAVMRHDERMRAVKFVIRTSDVLISEQLRRSIPAIEWLAWRGGARRARRESIYRRALSMQTDYALEFWSKKQAKLGELIEVYWRLADWRWKVQDGEEGDRYAIETLVLMKSHTPRLELFRRCMGWLWESEKP